MFTFVQSLKINVLFAFMQVSTVNIGLDYGLTGSSIKNGMQNHALRKHVGYLI